MDILQDLKEYQRQLTVWHGVMQMYQDKAAGSATETVDDTTMIEKLKELMALKHGFKVPASLIFSVMEAILIDVHKAGDHVRWSQMIAGKSDVFPSSLLIGLAEDE